MIRLRLERAVDWWRDFVTTPGSQTFQRLLRTIMVITWRMMGMIAWRLRVAWTRMGRRARVATSIVLLVLLSAATSSVATSISTTAQGLAVLLLAGVGFWKIATAPFRRRE